MPSFGVLKTEFRRRVIEEAVASELPGLIFTYVWALDLPEDAQAVARLVAPVVEAGGKIDCVELYADLPTRLSREGTPERLAAKPSKRDTEWARANVVDWNELWQRIRAVLRIRRRPTVHLPTSLMRIPATVTERLPGSIPLTRDLLTMLEAGDNVITNDDAVQTFKLPLVPLDEQLRLAT